jgi:methionine sulfoxide reductase catalytic subunit
MPLIQIPQPWQLTEKWVTSEHAFLNRRRFMKGLIGAGIAGATLPLMGCNTQTSGSDDPFVGLEKLTGTKTKFAVSDRPITTDYIAGTYNNFYEYGGSKNIWRNAQALPTENWKVEVTGLVNNPKTYDIDDLRRNFPIEERIYRFRCVEAWSMVIPWLGFPMNALLKEVEPKSTAKFVRFVSYYNPEVTKGPGFPPSQFLPFPYVEALRIDEMANDLAFFAVGNYGKILPKQHGAPIRAVIPWKYGFKGAKSIVKIEFVDQQPKTYWNTIDPNEYKFVSNVEPEVPHPRWSQATEKFVGDVKEFSYELRPTVIYNGYGEYVAQLYR